MKIGILHGYDPRNTGDAAITLAMTRMARSLYPRSSITLETRYFQHATSFFRGHAPDLEVVATAFPFPPPGSRTRSGFLEALRLRPQRRNYDLALLMGGGYLYSRSERRIPSPTAAHLLLELKHLRSSNPKVKISTGPISVGPISRLDRPVVSALLRTVDEIVVRDKSSYELVSRMGHAPHQAPDIALTRPCQSPGHTPNQPTTLAVNAMDWRWAGASENQWGQYRNSIRALSNEANRSGLDVVGFGMSTVPEQGQVDINTLRELTGDASATLVHGYEDVDALLATRPYVVSTRLHGAIMAMTRGAPTVHLSYQPKGIGTYRMLNLPHQVLDVRSVGSLSARQLLDRVRGVDVVAQSRAVTAAAVQTTDTLTRAWRVI